MCSSNKSSSNSRRARAAKRNVVAKVECGGCKSGANYWPVAMQLILYAAKSFIEEYFK